MKENTRNCYMRYVLSVLLLLCFCSLACGGKPKWEALNVKDPVTNKRQTYASKTFGSNYYYGQEKAHWISLTMVMNSSSNIDSLFFTGGGRKFRCPLKAYCFIRLTHGKTTLKVQAVSFESEESIRILDPDEFLSFFKNKKAVEVYVDYTDGSDSYDLDLSDLDLSMY